MAFENVIANRIPAIGHNQRPMLDDFLEQTYAQAGIAEDDPDSWARPAPSLADVMRVMQESGDKEAKGLINMVKALFGHAVFNKPQYLSAAALISRPLHINLRAISSDAVKGIVTDTLLRAMVRALGARGDIVEPKTDRAKFRTFLVVDEARRASTATMETVFRETRKFGLGAEAVCC